MNKRSFAEHALLVSEFARRVDELSPEAWERIRTRCRPLAGSTPAALFARAQAATMPIDFNLGPELPAIFHAIPKVTRGVMFATNMTMEVAKSAFPWIIDPPQTRVASTGRPDTDRVMDAFNTIEHALERNIMRIPSVALAVRTAAVAVMNHDQLEEGGFERVYQWLEPEIPYALLDPPATDDTFEEVGVHG